MKYVYAMPMLASASRANERQFAQLTMGLMNQSHELSTSR